MWIISAPVLGLARERSRLDQCVGRMRNGSAELNDLRMNVETEFKHLLDDIAKISDKLRFSTEAPRISAVSKFWADAAMTQTCYSVNVFIPAYRRHQMRNKRCSIRRLRSRSRFCARQKHAISVYGTWLGQHLSNIRRCVNALCAVPEITEEHARGVWAASLPSFSGTTAEGPKEDGISAIAALLPIPIIEAAGTLPIPCTLVCAPHVGYVPC